MAKRRVTTDTPLDELIVRAKEGRKRPLLRFSQGDRFGDVPDEFRQLFESSQRARSEAGVGKRPRKRTNFDVVMEKLATAAQDVDSMLAGGLLQRGIGSTARLLGVDTKLGLDQEGSPLESLSGPISTAPKGVLAVGRLFKQARGAAGKGLFDDAAKLYDEAIAAAREVGAAKTGISAMRAEKNAVLSLRGVAPKAEKAAAKAARTGEAVDKAAIQEAEALGAPIKASTAGKILREVGKKAGTGAKIVGGGAALGAGFKFAGEGFEAGKDFFQGGFPQVQRGLKERFAGPELALTRESIDRAKESDNAAKTSAEVRSFSTALGVQRLMDLQERRAFPESAEDLVALRELNRINNIANKVDAFNNVRTSMPSADPSRIAAAIARAPRDIIDLMRPRADEIAADNAVRAAARDAALEPSLAGPTLDFGTDTTELNP